MEFAVESNPSKCKVLWEMFSPHRTLWDEWETAFSFFDESVHVPYFVVLYDTDNSAGKSTGKKVGLLPLMYEKISHRYLFFGGEYIEDIHFWFDLDDFPVLWDFLPEPLCLYDINAVVFNDLIQRYSWIKSDSCNLTSHSYVDLSKYSFNFNHFISTFSPKHRKNLLYDLHNVEKQGYVVKWISNLSHFNTFVSFNIQRFAEESDFIDPIFANGMKTFLHGLSHRKKLYCSVISHKNKVIAVEYAAFHKEVYYVLNGGYNPSFKNGGKYLMHLQFKKACMFGAKSIDFLSGNDLWKKLWKLERVPYYTLKKGAE